MCAGALTNDEGQRSSVKPLLRIIDEPLGGVVTVLGCLGGRVLGRESLPDRDAEHARGVRHGLQQRVLRRLVLQHPAAAVDVHQYRSFYRCATGPLQLRLQDPGWDRAARITGRY